MSGEYKPSTEVKRGFHCDHYHHIWKLGPLALAIYGKIMLLGSQLGSEGEYFSSAERMSQYLGCNYSGCQKALKRLAKAGWLTALPKKNPFQPTHYIPVRHAAWAAAHPGQCFEREKLVWDDEEHDPLAVALYKVSAGKVRWREQWIKNVRKQLNLPDDEIAYDFQAFLNKLEPPPTNSNMWKRVPFDYMRHLTARGHANANNANGNEK
jgi:hypothetical protein